MGTTDFTTGNNPWFLTLMCVAGFTVVCLVLAVAFFGKPIFAQEEEQVDEGKDCKWVFKHDTNTTGIANDGYLLDECSGELYRVTVATITSTSATATKVEL